ncbi:hypothetical protein ACFQDG_18960 [Natronoarchaeum mannanilyticum]|uniref:DUF7266 family protein n=1 Tax=Natronoarchaeum mannanilyticum TaxID=926360 RepID=UPI0031E10CED
MTDSRSGAGERCSEGRFRGDARAGSAVVGKALEAAIVVLYVGLLTSTLYAGAIPEYRTAASQEVADRTLADTSAEIRDAVPPNASSVNATARIELPATIRGEAYALRVDGRQLVLDHPDDAVGGRMPLALPGWVDSIDGQWKSRDDAVVRIRGGTDGVDVRLGRGRS